MNIRMNIYRMQTGCYYITLKYIASINELFYTMNIIDVFMRNYLEFLHPLFSFSTSVWRQDQEETELIRAPLTSVVNSLTLNSNFIHHKRIALRIANTALADSVEKLASYCCNCISSQNNAIIVRRD